MNETAIKIQITCKAQNNLKSARQFQENRRKTHIHRHTCHESHTHTLAHSLTHTHTPTVIANVIKLCSASISALTCSILLRARLVDCQSGEEEQQCALAVTPSTHPPSSLCFCPALGRLANIIIFIIMTVVVTIKTITKTKVVSLHGN